MMKIVMTSNWRLETEDLVGAVNKCCSRHRGGASGVTSQKVVDEDNELEEAEDDGELVGSMNLAMQRVWLVSTLSRS